MPRPLCRALATAALALVTLFLPPRGFAVETGPRLTLDVGARYAPIGLSSFNEIGYRLKLSDSKGLFLKDTYVEGGIWTIASPAYIRSGAYFNAVPISVLEVRVSATYLRQFGNFGLAYTPADPEDPDWDLDTLATLEDGVAHNALIVETRITPRAALGNVVALVPIQHVYMRSDLDAEVFYEGYYDMIFEPVEQMWTVSPTLGYIALTRLSGAYLFTALRYERNAVIETETTSAWGGALAIWGMPESWMGSARGTLTGLVGYWTHHPTDREGVPFVAVKFGVTLGAR